MRSTNPPQVPHTPSTPLVDTRLPLPQMAAHADSMNRILSRARRLLDLYRLRGLVELEIATLEATHRRNRLPRRKPAMCGTDSGYYHHRRQKQEIPCDPCKLAHTLAQRRRERDRLAGEGVA